jgi:hypothetical protein
VRMLKPPTAPPVAHARLESPSPSVRLRLIRGVVGGAVAAAVVLALRLGGVLVGPIAVMAVVALALLVPVGRTLSQRALLVGSAVLGWLVVTFWLPLPVGGVGRATTLMALTAAGLVGWSMAGPLPRTRLRMLLPHVTVGDGVVAATTGVAAALLAPWLRITDPAGALALLLPGWDNSVHFDMVEMIRRFGLTVDGIGAAPGGETWSGANYNQSFHAVAATTMELLGPVRPAAGTELVTMVQATGWLEVLVIGLLAAGIVSLPAMARRPGVAVVAVAVVTAAFLLGPGAMAMPAGFPNFFFACGLAGCVPLVVMTADRITTPVMLALGGLLVGVANSWILLVVLALPAAVAVILPWRRDRWPATRLGWTSLVAITLLTAFGGLHALLVTSSLDAGAILTTVGGLPVPNRGTMAATIGAGVGLSVLALTRRPGRGAATSAAVFIGLAGGAALAVLQITRAKTLSYYFWKYAIGVELITTVLAVVALSALLDTGPATMAAAPTLTQPRRRRLLAGLAEGVGIMVLAAAAMQLYGFTGVIAGPLLVAPTADGMVQRQAASVRAHTPSVLDLQIWAATRVAVPPGANPVFISPLANDPSFHPINAQQWYLALSGRWTNEANQRTFLLLPAGPGPETLEARARRILDGDPHGVVIVVPESLQTLREALGPDAGRALSW